MKLPAMTRRSVLHLVLATTVTLIQPVFPFARPLPLSERDRLLARRVTNIFAARASAEFVGIRYLQRNPGEADITALLLLVAGSRHEVNRLYELDAASLGSDLGRFIRQDFLRGDITRLDGWILSATEARLMALAALSA